MIATHKLYLIVACDRRWGIGKQGSIPWSFPSEMSFFRKQTKDAPSGKKNMVVMGRKTWESIPTKFRPLPGRVNVVLSRQEDLIFEGAEVCQQTAEIVDILHQHSDIHDIYVIGGGSVYEDFLRHFDVDGAYITRLAGDYGCDVYFPQVGTHERVNLLQKEQILGEVLEYYYFPSPFLLEKIDQ